MPGAGHKDPEFGRRLRFAHIKYAGDLTQADIVRRLGITQSALSMYFHGKRIPPRVRLNALAKLFGVSVEWLETGRGPIKPEPSAYEILSRQLMTLDQDSLHLISYLLGLLESKAATVTEVRHGLDQLLISKNQIQF